MPAAFGEVPFGSQLTRHLSQPRTKDPGLCGRVSVVGGQAQPGTSIRLSGWWLSQRWGLFCIGGFGVTLGGDDHIYSLAALAPSTRAIHTPCWDVSL